MLKKSDINLKEWEFEFRQRNYQPILMSDLFCRSLYNNHKKEINLPTDKLDYLFTSSGRGYIKLTQKAKILKELKIASENKNDYLKYILIKTMERMKKLDNFADNVEINVETPNKELISLWKKFDEIFLTVIPWFYIPWYITEKDIVSDKVKEKLLKYRKEIEKITSFDNALAILIFPVKELMFQKEQKGFLELIKIASGKKNFRNDKSFINKARIYLKKYSWMTTYLILPIELLNMKDLINKVENALNNNFIEEYKKQKLKRSKDRKIADKIVKKIKNDKELILCIKLAREFGWLLTFSTETALMATSKLTPLFKMISERMNIPYEQWVYLTSKEIIKMLEGESVVTNKKIKERQLGYVFLLEKGKEKILSGKEGKNLGKWIDNNIGVINQQTNKLKGQSVSPGIVKGKIKIISFAKDAHLIKNGEVLVCSMTSPDYISAMKKSIAIITDEGGLLSHAAIVSRELGKPCVVGTKIATKVLKDGDLVEVDANKGVVKILGNKKMNNLEILIESYDWIYYLARPFNLFGASLWHQWYADPQMMEIFGLSLKKGLYIENPKGSVRQYREKKEFQELINAIEDLVLNNPGKCIKFLKEGFEINKKAIKNLEKNTFQNLKEAITFVVRLALLGALISYFAPEILKKYKKKNNEIEKLSMKLRKVSYYPPFIQKIIIPLAKSELKKLGVENKKAINAITMYELLERNVGNIELRLRKIKENECFIYQRINKKENVWFVENSSSIINDIEKISLDNVTEFKGNPAYKGKVIGRVKLILINNPKRINFNKGDILVAISTNPNLLSFIEKAAAIITDEGGITCHAAIISRELKIPCIVGTKIATKVLKDGDLVEVDANKGVVKIIK